MCTGVEVDGVSLTPILSLQSFLDTGIAHYKDLEERIFHTLKGEQYLLD